MNDGGTRALGVVLLLGCLYLLLFLVAMSAVDRWAWAIWRGIP